MSPLLLVKMKEIMTYLQSSEVEVLSDENELSSAYTSPPCWFQLKKHMFRRGIFNEIYDDTHYSYDLKTTDNEKG